MTARPIRLTGPSSIIEAIPYLLGFTPVDSLVLVGLREQLVSVTARVDLAELTQPSTLHQLATALADQAHSTHVLALTYGPAHDTAPIAVAVAASGMHLVEHLRVDDDRYWSLTCPDETCCPAEGQPVATDSAVAAEFVGLGLSTTGTRDELAAIFDPADNADRLWPLIDRARTATDASATDDDRTASAVHALVLAAGRDICRWTDEETAHLGVALTHVAVRDAIWMATDAGHLDGRSLFLHLARHLPNEYRVAPLFLFGWTAWRAGNGALASIAIDNALQADPAYSAAQLLQAALARAIDPRQMPILQLPAAD